MSLERIKEKRAAYVEGDAYISVTEPIIMLQRWGHLLVNIVEFHGNCKEISIATPRVRIHTNIYIYFANPFQNSLPKSCKTTRLGIR